MINIVSYIKLDRREKKINVGEICFLKICKKEKKKRWFKEFFNLIYFVFDFNNYLK